MTHSAPSHPPVSAEAIQALRKASTATITTQLFKRGFKNAFLHGPTPHTDVETRMVGEAFTMRCIPSREDLDPLSVFDDYDHPQRAGIESVTEGQILVIDARQQTRSASLGHILATRLEQRGAAGIVTDGTIRDAAGFKELGIPTFRQGTSPVTNLIQHHVVESQVPIGCAEVPVYPGDYLVGDQDGVVCIPRYLVEEVAQDAAEQELLEDFILSKIEEGKPLRNTYPASPELMEEYSKTHEHIQHRATHRG